MSELTPQQQEAQWLKENAEAIRNAPPGTRFEKLLRAKFVCDGSKTIEEYIESLDDFAAIVKRWKAAGVVLAGEVADDYARFVTQDRDFAVREGFYPAE